MLGPYSVTPASPPASAASTQRRGLVAGEGRDQDGVGQPVQGGVGVAGLHPFTAPATRPPTRRRRTIMKKISTGIVYRVEAAMIGPHCAPPRPKKYVT